MHVAFPLLAQFHVEVWAVRKKKRPLLIFPNFLSAVEARTFLILWQKDHRIVFRSCP